MRSPVCAPNSPRCAKRRRGAVTARRSPGWMRRNSALSCGSRSAWRSQALNPVIRTPDLTRRFEAALMVVEQRRAALVQAAQQEASAVRQNIHGLLHAAEQALVAGQLHAARAAADEIRKLKAGAGLLPKPTTQRLGRLVQQLVELERWESFGQQNARIQLCERAEAAAK